MSLADILYVVKRRIKLALGLYGYCFNVYRGYIKPYRPWYMYLLIGGALDGPVPVASFSIEEDALIYCWRQTYDTPNINLYTYRDGNCYIYSWQSFEGRPITFTICEERYIP
jgi:hypothetical protein